MGQFSQDDLNLAQKYPEFGLSVLSLKKDYNNATTAEQRLLANQAANELRKSYGNYSGGADGGSFRLESKLNRRSDDLLDQLGSFGSFSYGEAPTYEIIAQDGPPHNRTFEAAVSRFGVELAHGTGRTKKQAEQAAALAALQKLKSGDKQK